MKCKFFYSIIGAALLAAPMSSMAETVSQKEAAAIARTFFNAAESEVLEKPKLVFNGKRFTTDRLFSPYYVYNSPRKGFVVISAENKAFPILGYSLGSDFDPSDMDDDMRQRLSDFAREIELIRYDGRYPTEAVEAWTDIRGHIASILNGRSDMMRESAVEFPVLPQSRTETVQTDEEEDEPFAFHNDFIRQSRAEEQRRLDMFEEVVNPSEPVVRSVGGGNFEIRFPEEIAICRVYGTQGNVLDIFTYRNTDTAEIRLDREQPGFYIALVMGKSGKTYGFKLYK